MVWCDRLCWLVVWCGVALQHAGKHMEDSIAASYTALLLGCLCQGSQVRGASARKRIKRRLALALTCIFLSLSDQRDYCEATSAQRGLLHHDGNAEEVLEFHEPHRECDQSSITDHLWCKTRVKSHLWVQKKGKVFFLQFFTFSE